MPTRLDEVMADLIEKWGDQELSQRAVINNHANNSAYTVAKMAGKKAGLSESELSEIMPVRGARELKFSSSGGFPNNSSLSTETPQAQPFSEDTGKDMWEAFKKPLLILSLIAGSGLSGFLVGDGFQEDSPKENGQVQQEEINPEVDVRIE